MNIEQLKAMPIGQKTGGFDLNIKTHKKVFQIGKQWFQKVCLIDKKGDILADVNITSGSSYIPLNSQRILHITVCEVQESEDGLHLNAGKCGKKLLVHEHKIPDVVSWDGETSEAMRDWAADREAEIRGKIRHGIVCAIFSTGNFEDLDKDLINKWTDFVMTGA